jgi:hypothetical protein
VNTRDTAYGYVVCHGVPKSDTVAVPALPVLETPQVYPYPNTSLITAQSEFARVDKLAQLKLHK